MTTLKMGEDIVVVQPSEEVIEDGVKKFLSEDNKEIRESFDEAYKIIFDEPIGLRHYRVLIEVGLNCNAIINAVGGMLADKAMEDCKKGRGKVEVDSEWGFRQVYRNLHKFYSGIKQEDMSIVAGIILCTHINSKINEGMEEVFEQLRKIIAIQKLAKRDSELQKQEEEKGNS